MVEEGATSPTLLWILVPVLFLTLGVPFFCAVTGLLALVAGWPSLARRFAATHQPPGEELSFQVYGVGGVRENGVTVLVVSPEGLFLRPIVFFRVGRRPLLIPWEAIESVTPGRFRFRPSYLLAIQGGGTVRVGEGAYERMRTRLAPR